MEPSEQTRGSSKKEDYLARDRLGLGLSLALWICNLCLIFGIALLDVTSTLAIPFSVWCMLIGSLLAVQFAFFGTLIALSRNRYD